MAERELPSADLEPDKPRRDRYRCHPLKPACVTEAARAADLPQEFLDNLFGALNVDEHRSVEKVGDPPGESTAVGRFDDPGAVVDSLHPAERKAVPSNDRTHGYAEHRGPKGPTALGGFPHSPGRDRPRRTTADRLAVRVYRLRDCPRDRYDAGGAYLYV